MGYILGNYSEIYLMSGKVVLDSNVDLFAQQRADHARRKQTSNPLDAIFQKHREASHQDAAAKVVNDAYSDSNDLFSGHDTSKKV